MHRALQHWQCVQVKALKDASGEQVILLLLWQHHASASAQQHLSLLLPVRSFTDFADAVATYRSWGGRRHSSKYDQGR